MWHVPGSEMSPTKVPFPATRMRFVLPTTLWPTYFIAPSFLVADDDTRTRRRMSVEDGRTRTARRINQYLMLRLNPCAMPTVPPDGERQPLEQLVGLRKRRLGETLHDLRRRAVDVG